MSEASIVFRKFEVEAGGRKWTLPRPTFSVEAAFGRYLEGKAADVINRNRVALGQIGYAEAMRQWVANSVSNHYGWMRQGFIEAIDSPENMAVFIMHWVNSVHPTEIDPLHIPMTGRAAYMLYVENRVPWDKALNEVFADRNPLLPE